MKKILLILSLLFFGFAAFAQDDNSNDDRGGKLQQRMQEYIQKRLNLSKGEAEKFSPVFLRYIVELRKTHRENASDKIILQQKIADLRVRYRNEFRQVLDEQRANKVFEAQREFEGKIINELKNRQLENRPLRRTRALFQ
jgi:nitrate reductase assembly molybdenum cofactor insertion protein NarJ